MSHSSRPNILWFFTDEQRADSIGAYGAAWAHSPHADALAARGTRFETAYTPSPVCVAARAALLTGRTNSHIGVLNNHHHLKEEHARFLTHSFVDAGYNVASFGKQHYCCKKKAFPTEGGRVLDEYVSYSEYLVAVNEAEMNAVQHPTGQHPWLLAGRHPAPFEQTAEMQNVRDALEWLENQPNDAPFFLRVSQNAPHTPTVAPAPFDTMIDPAQIDLPLDRQKDIENPPVTLPEYFWKGAGSDTLSEAQIQRTRQSYYGRCAFVDEVFGQLLNALGDRLENTIVVFCSDHGTHLGDHGFYQKQSFYQESVRVPWLLAGPGVAQNQTLKTPVSLGSLLPTLLELCGLDVPDADFPSLATPLRNGIEPEARPIISEIDFGIWKWRDGDRYAMVREGDWKLACFPDTPDDGGAMLFNLKSDPHERHNLAGDARFRAQRDELLAQFSNNA